MKVAWRHALAEESQIVRNHTAQWLGHVQEDREGPRHRKTAEHAPHDGLLQRDGILKRILDEDETLRTRSLGAFSTSATDHS